MLSDWNKSLPFLGLSCSICKAGNLYQSLPILPPNCSLSFLSRIGPLSKFSLDPFL